MYQFFKGIIGKSFGKVLLVSLLLFVIFAAYFGKMLADEYFSGAGEELIRLEERRMTLERELGGLEDQLERISVTRRTLMEAIDAQLEQVKEVKARYEMIQVRIMNLSNLWMSVKSMFGMVDDSEMMELRLAQKQVSEERMRLGREIRMNEKSVSESDERIAPILDRRSELDGELELLGADITYYRNVVNKRDRLQLFVDKAWRIAYGFLIPILFLVFLGPLVLKAFLYFVWARVLRSVSKPVKITSQGEGNRLKYGTSAPSQVIILEVEEELLLNHDYAQASDSVKEDGGFESRMRWVLSWRYPFTSLCCQLVGMTAFVNRSEGVREVTVSHRAIADREITIIELEEGQSLILRPRFIAGIAKEVDVQLRIKSHWRLWSLQSWITLQFRYFEFYGPCRIALWATRGVRVETIGGDGLSKTVDSASVIGYSPALGYHSRPAENFFPYLCGKNALFDDHFSGSGHYLCQQVSKESDGASRKTFWERFFELAGKPFGL